VVFQSLPNTLGVGADVWRVLAKAHELRNAAEYEGYVELDELLVSNLVDATERVYKAAKRLGVRPPAK